MTCPSFTSGGLVAHPTSAACRQPVLDHGTENYRTISTFGSASYGIPSYDALYQSLRKVVGSASTGLGPRLQGAFLA